jgi:hypothetical protein
MAKTLFTRSLALPAATAMRISVDALERALDGDAELTVTQITTDATVVGAFQRHHGLEGAGERVRRISGGPFVTVGPGTLHVLLALAQPSSLVACDPRRIVNRYVRPLLRALAKSGALTHYFGREWISTAHRPVGQVGFAHDSRTGRAVFEAFVALSYPFAPPGRSSFRGKEPTTLERAMERALDRDVVAGRIFAAYASLAEHCASSTREASEQGAVEAWDDPPWAASIDEAIGVVAAGRDVHGVLRLGGDLLASRDALDRVASQVAALPEGAGAAAIGAIVDRELTSESVGLDGIRDLTHVRDVLARARFE